LTKHIPYTLWQTTIIPALTTLIEFVNIVGLAVFLPILWISIQNFITAFYIVGFGLVTLDFLAMFYVYYTYALVSLLNTYSIRLAVCCQYTENGQTFNITNANISAFNIEDNGTFGTFYLYPNNEQPGWYYTKPVLYLPMFIPPGYWNITIKCDGFKTLYIETNNIPIAGIYSTVSNLTSI